MGNYNNQNRNQYPAVTVNNNTGGGFNVSRGYNSYGTNRNNNNSYNQGNNNPQGPKRSWAVYNYLKDLGVHMVNAFRISKRFGLIKYTVKPYHATFTNDKKTEVVIVTSDNNKTYHKMICVIETEFAAPQTIPVLFCLETRKIAIQEKGLVITPNGNGTLRNGRHVKGAVVKFT